MNVLYLITARGGSKGVPGKNLKRIGGISLVGFKALSAKKSRYCSRLMISTDSSEIQADARSYGVEVPFTRPAELATDTAKSAPVILHAMEWIEREGRERYDAVMLLEPSSPFARAADYDAAVEMMIERNANAVLGVAAVHAASDVVGPLGPSGELTAIVDKIHRARERAGQRQTLGREYTMNGALYLFRWDYFKAHQWIYHDRDKVYGYVMDRVYSIEIDEPIDLLWAEFLVAHGHVPLTDWTN